MKFIFILFILGANLAMSESNNASKLFTTPVKTINSKETTLAEYAGKVLLFVNVASKCGYTKQYDGLEALYKKYKDQGLVILGFPSNDFLWQEPGTNKDIAEFCKLRFGVTFPLFEKNNVKGKNIQPIYKELVSQGEAIYKGPVGWNFEKFLVGKDGKVIGRFKSAVKPEDKDFVTAIEKALAAAK